MSRIASSSTSPPKPAPAFPSQLFVALLSANVLLVSAYLLRLPFHETSLGHARLLDLNAESSLKTWLSSLQLLLIAALAGSIALSKPIRGGPAARPLWAFAALFVALSVDETAQVHEAIGHLSSQYLSRSAPGPRVAEDGDPWLLLLGVPLVAVLAGLGWRVRTLFDRVPGSASAFARGTGIWLGGALGLEALSRFTAYYETWNVLQVAAEEGCELLGTSLMVRALGALAIAWHRDGATGRRSRCYPAARFRLE